MNRQELLRKISNLPHDQQKQISSRLVDYADENKTAREVMPDKAREKKS